MGPLFPTIFGLSLERLDPADIEVGMCTACAPHVHRMCTPCAPHVHRIHTARWGLAAWWWPWWAP
eukprot:scaffold99776_cov30-Phaeocystis_antarctica.AAC.1